MLKGLPACGKSTYAKELLKKEPGKWKRINKDDLRAMLDNGEWSKENEKLIIEARNKLIIVALTAGYSVIVDDTNFDDKHEEYMKKEAEIWKIEFEVKFIDTPRKVCIERDAKREKPVGQKVIDRMYFQYVEPMLRPAPKPRDPNLPDCILVDIDGTLAHMTGRSAYDYSRVKEDAVDYVVRDLVNMHSDELSVFIVSARDGGCRADTEQWLKDNDVKHVGLFMREAGDKREDSLIKEELYNAHFNGKYNVRFVLDDRDRVVAKWRSLGLKVLQVAPGNF